MRKLERLRAGLGAVLLLMVGACSDSKDGTPSANGSGGAAGMASNAGGASGAGASGAGGAGGVAGAGAGGAPVPVCPKFDRNAVPPDVTVLVDAYPFGIDALVGVVSGQVYYVDNKVLKRVPVAGGAPMDVGPVGGTPFLRGTDLLVWTTGDSPSAPASIVTAPLDDPSKTTVVADKIPGPEYITADATSIYWDTRMPQNIYRAPIAGGGTPEILVPGGSPLGTLVHDGYFWWLDFQSNQLERISLSGGTREHLTEVHFGGPMAADADAVYWGDTSLKTIEKWTPAGGRQMLAHADPDMVVVADGIIYWTDGFVTGSIRSIHTDGTGSKPLLCNLTAPGALFVDGSYVVTSSDVGILRVPR